MTLKSFHLLAAVLALSRLVARGPAQSGVARQPGEHRRAGAGAARRDPRAAIVKKIDGLKLEDVRMTPVNGIYEITRGSEISYTSSDGRYVILGDMIDLDSDANLSENRRRAIRASA